MQHFSFFNSAPMNIKCIKTFYFHMCASFILQTNPFNVFIQKKEAFDFSFISEVSRTHNTD